MHGALNYNLQREGSERASYSTAFFHYQLFTTLHLHPVFCLTYPLACSVTFSPWLCLSTGSGMLRLNLRCKHTAGQSTTGLSATHMPLRLMHQACWWATSSLGFRLNSTMDIWLLLFHFHVEFQNLNGYWLTLASSGLNFFRQRLGLINHSTPCEDFLKSNTDRWGKFGLAWFWKSLLRGKYFTSFTCVFMWVRV